MGSPPLHHQEVLHIHDSNSVLALPGFLLIRGPQGPGLTRKPKTARMRALRVWSVNR